MGAESQWKSAGNWKTGHSELASFSTDFLLCENYWHSGILTESRISELQNNIIMTETVISLVTYRERRMISAVKC